MATARLMKVLALFLMLGLVGPLIAAEEAAPPVVPTLPSDYRIGPGDALQMFVWRNPELSVTVPVRPDGKISAPLVGDMIAVGKTPAQLASDLEVVLAEYVRSPKVNVIVTQPVSTFSQVKVVGQVGKPQSVAFREGLTVMDVMLAVGGLGEFAAGNRSKIVRTDADGKEIEIKLRLVDLLNKGDMKQNQALKPGDVIVVPQSRF
ncbi:MAG: XrtA/PEP-CTERM system exopolysaccharide export protein [Gammaproteobacteria bacterium]